MFTNLNINEGLLYYHVVMWEEIRKFVLAKILKKHYYRTGKCKGCGQCCTHIYVKHFKHVLKDEKEFEKLPQEELFSMGGTLSEDCGYKMEPIIPFKKVLDEVERKSNRKKRTIIPFFQK